MRLINKQRVGKDSIQCTKKALGRAVRSGDSEEIPEVPALYAYT